MTTPLQFTIFLDDIEYAIEGDYTEGCPAQISGPPENCYPEEYPYFEITSIKLDGREIGEHELPETERPGFQNACEQAAEKAIELLRQTDEAEQAERWED